MIPEVKVEHQNGYLGEIMVYRPTGEIGTAEEAVESKTGWTIEISLKLKDGSVRKGQPSDFAYAKGNQRSQYFS